MPSRSERSSGLFRHPVSVAGISLTVVCTAVGLPLLLLDIFGTPTHPYAGLLIYGVLPAFGTLGLLLIGVGAIIERRRRSHFPGRTLPPLPKIDLNDPRQRQIFVGVLALGLGVLVLLSVTSYRAYNFTDSVQFCGEICHGVMKPEYTTYQHSPHARVACVSCHVGPGASYYVKSKITGAYQVYSVIFHKYPRPIATPVHDLRPAQETCEQCHWPAKFFGAQQKTFTHYLTDEKNSPWQIEALLKIGGGDPKNGDASGIHWHMNIKNDIYYAASDPGRETIPYVKAVDKQGHVTEYMSTENPPSKEQLAKTALRRMDCVDCHSRPSHIFKSPEQAVSLAMESGRLNPQLPFLKREAMRLLAGSYATEAEAQAAIEKELPGFYEKSYPALYQEKSDEIRRTAQVVEQLLAENVFPEMKADWRAHPNHIGHLNSDGCFRCHDGLHKSQDGKVITNDCNTCHTILAQGPPEKVAGARLQAQPFKHPVDLGMDVTTMKCSTCHTGTTGL